MTENKYTEAVGVCHPDWRGIKAATYSLVPKVFEVPEIRSYEEAQTIASDIVKHEPKKVVLSGYPQGYHLLAKALKEKNSLLRIFFLSHASFTWYTDRPAEASWLQDMFEAYENGLREKGVNAFFVMNRPPDVEEASHAVNEKNPQIGVWGAHMWHRNLLNQVVGSLMVKGSQVHVNEIPKYFFWDDARIQRHGILSREKYIPVLRSMDVNLYVSFTDCFPMTVVESISCGIPCLASDTSEVYSWSPYLKEHLVLSKVDSPVAMRERVEWLLGHSEEVQSEMAAYLPVLKQEIEKSIQQFLE